MATYLVLCAATQDPHEHVVSLTVRKWRPKKGGYRTEEDLSRAMVASKIKQGDSFYVAAPSRATAHFVVTEVIVEKCVNCTLADTIKTRRDATTNDNLDYLSC